MSYVGHMKKILILSFDIPREKGTLRKRIWRKLIKHDVESKHDSYWCLPLSKSNLKLFTTLSDEIIKYGGKAEVIKGEKIG